MTSLDSTTTNNILKGDASGRGFGIAESSTSSSGSRSGGATMARHLHFPSDPLNIDFDHGRIEILLHHNAMGKNWIPICGFDSYETSDIIWDTSKCVTEHLLHNVTRCICPISGTYVVLLEQQKLMSQYSGQAGSVMLVITSCLCFIQSSTTFIVLVPLLYKHKCAVTFLKMQFCTAIATISGTMIVGFSQQIPYNWNNILTCAIGAILLLATCSLIGIILLISFGVSQQEQQLHHNNNPHQQVYRKESGGSTNNNYFGPQPNSSSRSSTTTPSSCTTLNSTFLGGSQTALVVTVGLKCAITFSWILPTLYCIILWLIRTVMRTHSATWWLKFATVECNLLIVNQMLLGILFYLLYGILVKRLVLLPKALDQKFAFAAAAAASSPSPSLPANQRVGLLVRLGIVYTLYLLVVSSYLTYLNFRTPSLEYLTGALQFLMGSAVLISFAIHPEKTPKPLNRKSASANVHNLNILERDVVPIVATSSNPEATSSSMPVNDVILLQQHHQHQQQIQNHGDMDLTGKHNVPVNVRIVAYNHHHHHQALLSSLPSPMQSQLQQQDFHMDDAIRAAMECDVRPMSTERSPLALAVEASSSRFTVRDTTMSSLAIKYGAEPPSDAPLGLAATNSGRVFTGIDYPVIVVAHETSSSNDHSHPLPLPPPHHPTLPLQPETCSTSLGATVLPQQQQNSTSSGGGGCSNNMLDRITDDLNFLLNGSTEDMMTFTPSHLYPGKQKLPTIQETMVGISEEFEMRTEE